VIPPPAPGADDQLLDVVRTEPEPGTTDKIELVDAEAAFAHVLHSGRAVLAELSAEDEDFLGLPGILSPEQTAALLSRRDAAARRRATEPGDATPSRETARWREGAELRREVNRLVSILAARRGVPHAQVHAEVRRAVPGPVSAAADIETLERRRDHLMGLV
jgi:hypothetical protein